MFEYIIEFWWLRVLILLLPIFSFIIISRVSKTNKLVITIAAGSLAVFFCSFWFLMGMQIYMLKLSLGG